MAHYHSVPIHIFGIVDAINCTINNMEYIQLSGKSLNLRNFGFSIASYYSAYNGGPVEPLPTNPSGGGLASGVKPAHSCADGNWCVMIRRDDTSIISNVGNNELMAQMVVWHYYYNGTDHLYVPELSSWRFTPSQAPQPCTGCNCP